ncbi:MAG: helix-turn-helix domain-containing protein [bacterium]
MLKTKANVQSKLLTIQQVAAMTQITPRQLRYWERYGVVKPKFVNKGRRQDRRYSLRDVAMLKKALHLRKKKMSIRKLSKIIKNPGLQFDVKAFDIEQKFSKERNQLIGEALTLLRDQINDQIKALESSPSFEAENNDYIRLVSKVENVENLLAELE